MVQERPSEPRVFGTALDRQDFVRDNMGAFKAAGVVLPHLPMCDFWGFEKHNFDAYADSHAIPVLSLNVDYIVGNTGQLRTRVQAFIETLT
jgi:benzoyl-CoA reductase/2-hydroxyglutaryl-CoA dehydratase subunit BcrC/BadD/HgdB